MTDDLIPEDTPTVLVVEDDKDLADTYALWLESEYEVRTAYTGAGGLTWYGPTVDVVLLDRRMPGISGVSTLQSMADRDIDDQKAILTSVDPGNELVDLPCDEYVTKPVTKTELRNTVRELQMRSELDDDFQQLFTLTTKIATLRNSDTGDTDAAIDALQREADRIQARVDDRFSDLDDFKPAFKTLQ